MDEKVCTGSKNFEKWLATDEKVVATTSSRNASNVWQTMIFVFSVNKIPEAFHAIFRRGLCVVNVFCMARFRKELTFRAKIRKTKTGTTPIRITRNIAQLIRSDFHQNAHV